MQLKKGYKRTEIGIIPENWEIVSYGDTFEFLQAATYSRSQLSDNGDVGYVHYGDIHTKCHNFLDLDKLSLPFVSQGLPVNYPRLKEGDIIVVDASEDYEGVGKSVEVKNLKDRQVISGLHTFLLREKNRKIANGFKGYIHSIKSVKKQMDTLATGLKVYGISKFNLKKIFFPLPPLHEQQAIANVLNDTDNLITELENLIEKKINIKQGALQELLTPKEDWIEMKLGDIGEVRMCKRIFNNETSDRGDIPFFKIGTFGKSPDAYISRELYESYKKRYSFPKKGEILISAAGTIGRTLIYDGSPSYYQDSNIVWIENDERLISNELLYYVLNVIRYNTEGGTIQRLYNNIIRNSKFYLPLSKNEQVFITKILSDMDDEIKELQIQLEKYKALKQGMMQQLLTGKIRLV